MSKKTILWHQAQQAQRQAHGARMERLDLLGYGDPALERQARELARVADEHDAEARVCLDEMNALSARPAVEIDWADLTNY